jgi:hypothetical protein
MLRSAVLDELSARADRRAARWNRNVRLIGGLCVATLLAAVTVAALALLGLLTTRGPGLLTTLPADLAVAGQFAGAALVRRYVRVNWLRVDTTTLRETGLDLVPAAAWLDPRWGSRIRTAVAPLSPATVEIADGLADQFDGNVAELVRAARQLAA